MAGKHKNTQPLWPTNLVILLFAASSLTVIYLQGAFINPRVLWQNGGMQALAMSGWGQLAGVLAMVGVLMLAAAHLRRRAARRVQFCVLVSLLVHFWAAVYLHVKYLPLPVAWTVDREDPGALDADPLVKPDYNWERIDNPEVVEGFAKPLGTSSPAPGEATVAEQRLVDQAPPTTGRTMEEPGELHRYTPDPTHLQRAELGAPRFAEQAGGPILSRQELRQSLDPGEAIPLPELKAGNEPTPLVPRGEVAAARQAENAPAAGYVPAAEPARAPEAVGPARRARSVVTTGDLAAARLPTRRSLPLAMEDIQVPDAPASAQGAAPRGTFDAAATGPVRSLESPLAVRVSSGPGTTDLPVEVAGLSRPSLGRRRAEQTFPSAPAREGVPMLRGSSPERLPEMPAEVIDVGPGAGGVGPGTGSMAGAGSGSGGAPVGVPGGTPGATGGTGAIDAPAGAGMSGPNRELGGLQVLINAPPGPGGFGVAAAPVAGFPSRRARPGGEAVHGAPERFVFTRSGGLPMMDSGVRGDSRPAFQGRSQGMRGGRGSGRPGADVKDRLVERGLEYFAHQQFPQGNWALDRTPSQGLAADAAGMGTMNADTAATGLGLLVFLGCNETHLDGDHQEAVRRGLLWLLNNQQPNGQLFTEKTDQNPYARFYGHAIGTIALCEAYGMTGDSNLREPAQRAVNYILRAQHPQLGGWRYAPQTDSDTSVSGWKLMALKSAQMAGLEVPPAAFEGVGHWLDLAQSVEGTKTDGSRYRYNPNAKEDNERVGREPNLPMTAEGLLMRMYLGWNREHPAVVAGANRIRENLPDLGDSTNPHRDSYYWYYGTQLMFQMGGDYWTAWNERLVPMLEKTQETSGPLAGSWHPSKPTRDRWSDAAGRHYVTSLNLLMLEADYRHQPLYRPK